MIDMSEAEQVKNCIVGTFTNEEQFQKLSENQKKVFPFAKHISHCLNDCIKGIPENFEGYYVLEESYYHIGDANRFKTDLFLISQNEKGQAQLFAVTLPKENMSKKYEELLPMNFSQLTINPRFNAIVYTQKNGVFSGYS